MESIRILGTGSYLPPTVLNNYDLAKSGLDTSHEWIVQRTGVSERRIADAEETASDLGYEASLKALEMAGTYRALCDRLERGWEQLSQEEQARRRAEMDAMLDELLPKFWQADDDFLVRRTAE